MISVASEGPQQLGECSIICSRQWPSHELRLAFSGLLGIQERGGVVCHGISPCECPKEQHLQRQKDLLCPLVTDCFGHSVIQIHMYGVRENAYYHISLCLPQSSHHPTFP